MGSGSVGQSKQNSKSSSSTTTLDSGLSNAQLKILKQRQQEYQNYWLPMMQTQFKEGLSSSTPGSKQFNASMYNNAQQVNQAFNAAQANTNQALAQQGVASTGNGVAAALKAQNERARASALAQAYNQQLTQANADRQKYTEMAGTFAAAMSPSPTGSAEYHQTSESKSKGGGSGFNAGLSILN